MSVVGGASVTSKRPARMQMCLRSVKSKGCRVLLEDSRWYIDWSMSLAGYLYGFRPQFWVDALKDAIDAGPASSIAHCNERVVATMLESFYPDIESVRFCLNGSDPCAAAIKLARAVTSRERILCQGYHGTCSAFASPPEGFEPDNRRGCMQAEQGAYMPLVFGDSSVFDSPGIFDLPELSLDRFSAIIVEVPPDDGGYDRAKVFLHTCADRAHKAGALFVLDEVVTGFRLAPGGAAEYYGLQGKVDLYCFGKTLGNGYPVSVLAGKKEVMKELTYDPDVPNKGLVHFSATFFGEPLGLAAAKATLCQLRKEPPWDTINELGTYLKEQWNVLGLPWQMVGHPSRPIVDVRDDDEDFLDLRRFLLQRGHIFVNHPLYITMAHHEEDVDNLLDNVAMWRI